LWRGEQNIGSYSAASHSANQASRVVQHRMNAGLLWDEIQATIQRIKNLDDFDMNEADFTLVDF
jgi:hypothetical protein